MNWDKNQIPDQTGKRVLITGANSGLGFETAKALYEKGADVIIACRNAIKGESAVKQIQQAVSSSGSLEVMVLDLASLESVRAFIIIFKEKYESLDILINNAGIMALPFARTEDGFESQFGTNHLGHFALTGPLLPLLEKADKPRVVVVSSIVNRLGYINFNNLNAEKSYFRWLAYFQSKLANIVFAKELQKRLHNGASRIKVVCAHPGFSSTNLMQHVPGNKLIGYIFSQPQEMGCLPSLYAACSGNIEGGEYIGPRGFLETRGFPKSAKTPKIANDRGVAHHLWQKSVELTDCEYLT